MPDHEVVPPRPETRGFRKELTPIWLATTAVLNGQRPPDVSRPFRIAYLGCGTGELPAIVAAVYPHAEVWAWDRRTAPVEATRALRDAARLDNLVVHERAGLPPDLGGDLADVIVVSDLFEYASDHLRSDVVRAIGAGLRPGGLVCVSYKTTVGWGEITPVAKLMRHVASGDGGDSTGVAARVLGLLVTLRSGGATYLTERPVVAAWLDELLTTDPAVVTTEYLADELRPVSHAQIEAMLATVACDYIGSAQITDDLGLEVPDALVGMLADAPTRVLRETCHDLAVRRTHRSDVFRLGSALMTPTQRAEAFAALDLAGLVGPDAEIAAPLGVRARKRLDDGWVTVGALHRNEAEAAIRARLLLGSRAAHPVATPEPSQRAFDAARAVTAVLDRERACARARVAAAPVLGTAVALDPAPPEVVLERIGAR